MNRFRRTILLVSVVVSSIVGSSAGTAPPVPVSGATELPARAADANDPGTLARPAFHIYTDQSGLPQSSITEIARDADGYLWVGTQDGAAYYDGRVWTPVDMPDRLTSNYVDSVCAASDGSMLFGTDKAGVCRLKDGKWTTIDTSNGLPGNSIHSIVEAPNPAGGSVLWIGTDRGLARMDGDHVQVYDASSGLPSSYVTKLALVTGNDGSDVLWVGTFDGVARLANGVWTSYGESSGLPHGFVLSVYAGPPQHGRRSIWACTSSGPALFDGQNWHVLEGLSHRPDIATHAVLESVDATGEPVLWVGLVRGGLARWRRGQWTFFNMATGLGSNEVTTLYETGSPGGPRALWIGTNGGGLARMDYGAWLHLDTSDGLPSESILSFLDAVDSDGAHTIWLGSRSGLLHLDKGQWVVDDTTTGLPGLGVRSLLQTMSPDGTRVLWAGTSKGLARRVNGRWSVLTMADGLPSIEILSLVEGTDVDGQSAIWVCTGGGLAQITRNGIVTYSTANGLPDNRVQRVVETRSSEGKRIVWIGTDNGVARLENGNWRIYTTRDGLANNTILSMRVDNPAKPQTLWVGTFGGVSRLDLTDPNAVWTTLSDTTDVRLPNNSVSGIQMDAFGRVYLCTNKGIARLTSREPTADDPREFDIYTFTTEDGLPSNESYFAASMMDHLGRIWVGTTGGAAVLDPKALPDDTTAKPLRIEKVLVGGLPREVRSENAFKWNENDLVIEYALISFYREKDTRFRTELVGLDKGPRAWSADAKRECSNLPAGDYTLRVWGRDYAGNVSGPAELVFRITPAPWRTWWAYLLYVLTIACAIYLVVRWRLQLLKRQNIVLEARIAERTAELGEKVVQLRQSEQKALDASRAKSIFLASMSHELRTPLNAILGFVQLMERRTGRVAEDREHLSIIARSGEHLLSLINDVLSLSKIEAGQLTLNVRSFDLQLLLQNLEEMFRLRAQAKGLQLLVESDRNIPPFVSGDDGKLRQILINLLVNAFKFTDTGGVALRVKWHGGICFFEVEDTGQGIAPEEMDRLFEAFVQTSSGLRSSEGTGLGLAISRNYIQLMGGEIQVTSEPGTGSRFSFHVPLEMSDAPDLQHEEMQVVGLETNQPAFRVLVVDDRWENRRLLSQLLSSVGFQVKEASNGAEALELWEKWPAEIVLMDIQMPVVDGYEAARRIRALEATNGERRTCILAVTASAFSQDREAIEECGCDDMISKPFRNVVIFEKLAEHAGVRFVYDRSVRETDDGSGRETAVTTDRLAALPPRLVDDLNQAVVQGDIERSLRLVDEIRKLDAPLGAELHLLVRAYRFDDILERVGRQ